MSFQLLVVGMALGISFMLATSAAADIAAPEPNTLWQRDQAPDPAKVIIAGTSFSAAFAISGLLVLRRGGRKSMLAKIFLGALSVALICAVAGTVFVSQKAKADQQAWEQYDRQEENRRRNWRPPPRFDQPPPEKSGEQRAESREPEKK